MDMERKVSVYGYLVKRGGIVPHAVKKLREDEESYDLKWPNGCIAIYSKERVIFQECEEGHARRAYKMQRYSFGIKEEYYNGS